MGDILAEVRVDVPSFMEVARIIGASRWFLRKLERISKTQLPPILDETLSTLQELAMILMSIGRILY